MFKRMAGLICIAGLTVAMLGVAHGADRAAKDLYEGKCKMCHATGAAGAPKMGDKVWLDLEKKPGVAALVKSAIKGKAAMPPKGGCMDCTEGEMKALVEYIIQGSKAKK